MTSSTFKHLFHPINGQAIVPVGYRSARPGEVGRQPIWPIIGGSGEGEGGAGQGGEGNGDTPPVGTEFTPITTQADLDKLIGPRLERERGKFADYDDLKAKVADFDKLTDASKSEIEKAQAEVAKVPSLVADALRTHLVSIHSIDADKADLFLTAADPDLLLRQVQALVGTEADRLQNGNQAPREGDTPPNKPADEARRSFVRNLTGRD